MSKKTKLSTDPYKGVRDFYPEDQAFLNYLFATCRGVAQSFGYVEYHASILEPSELYKSKGAENEEIVNEQTYTFVDRGGREVTLRPEMTPSVARMVSARRRELGFPLRLFSLPNLFRYERPQRGRLREHWQLNVDLFGSKSLSAEAEILDLIHSLMLSFGAKDTDFIIKLGSRAFLDRLVDEYSLDEENAKKFITLLDKRDKIPKEDFDAKLKELGVPHSALSPDSIPEDIEKLLELLANKGIHNIEFDPSIVRGFDYYTGIVFEVFDTHPENNRALFGGGRYDNLTALFDEEAIVGVGFGMGDVAMRDFLLVRDLLLPYMPTTKVYVAVVDESIVPYAMDFADTLRVGGVNVAVDFGEKKLADQIKTATKHKIPYLIVIGDDERASKTFTVRSLHDGKETKLKEEELPTYFQKN